MSKKSVIGATSVGVVSSLLAFVGFVSCCGMPIVAGILSSIGIGATQLSFFVEYQPYFLLLSIVSLGFGFWSLYFRSSSSGCCGAKEESKSSCCSPKPSKPAESTSCCSSTPKPVAPVANCCTAKPDAAQFTFAPTASATPAPEKKCCSIKSALPHIILWVAALFVAKILFIDMESVLNPTPDTLPMIGAEGANNLAAVAGANQVDTGVNTLIETMQYFVFIVFKLILLFVGVTAIIEVIMMHIPKARLRKWLSGRGVWGNILATIFGSLTPFCACSTIPMTVGFLRAGVSFGSVMSFLISSPLLNPIIIGMLVALMGAKAAISYFAIAFVASVIFGYILEKIGGEKYVKPQYLNGAGGSIDGVLQEDARLKLSFGRKCIEGLKVGWSTLKPVMGYLLIGVAIGAAIYGYMPEKFILSIAGADNPFAVPIAAILGVPLYIRAETAIPIGIALMGKGMSIGAVIALIIGGAGMAIPEMTMMASIFKRKLVIAIAATIFLTATIGGYIFNLIM